MKKGTHEVYNELVKIKDEYHSLESQKASEKAKFEKAIEGLETVKS